VFSRFNKFYKTVLAGAGATTENAALFTLLNELAKTGINNLIRTYNQTDKIHILHTLQMYKGMLDNPELVRRIANRPDDAASAAAHAADDELPRQYPMKTLTSSASVSTSDHHHPVDSVIDTNVDLIFIKITDLYSQEDYTIIYHTLLKIQNDTQYYLNYVEGLNKILEPVNIRIKKWIDDNIVF
jgi:hypothetical protein